MKTMEDLKKSLHDNKDAIVIIGSKASTNVLAKLSDEDKEKLVDVHTNKSFRRKNDEYWIQYDNIFGNIIESLQDNSGNVIFKTLKPLIDKGLIKRIYYQDIDGQIPENDNNIYIKGSINKFECSNVRCQKKYELDKLPEDKRCTKCKKEIRPTFIFFGDNYKAEVEKMLVDDLNDTSNIITIGLDLSEEYILGLVDAFDQKRVQEDKMKEKNIVAIHDEDEKEIDYNELFLCDFQALGDLNESIKRLIDNIL